MYFYRLTGWAPWMRRGALLVLLGLVGCAGLTAAPPSPLTPTSATTQALLTLPTVAGVTPTATLVPSPTITVPLPSATLPLPTLIPTPHQMPVPALPEGFVSMNTTITPQLPESVLTTDNVASLRLLRTVGMGWINDAAIAPGGKLLAVATQTGMAFFELPSQRLLRFEQGVVQHVALSPDGTMMIADTILLRINDQKKLASVPDRAYRFSPNGQLVVTRETYDKLPSDTDLSKLTAEIRRSADGKLLRTILGYAATFSADNQLLAVTTGTEVQLLRLSTSDLLQSFTVSQPGDGYVYDLALSADGQFLYVALKNAVQTWRIADGNLIHTTVIEHPQWISCFPTLSPNGTTFATICSEVGAPDITLQRTLDEKLTYQDIDEYNTDIRFSSDETIALLWGYGDDLQVFDTQMETLTKLRLPAFRCLTFSPDALTLVAAASRVYLWDVIDGSLRQMFDNPGGTESDTRILFTPDSQTLMTVGQVWGAMGYHGDYANIWNLRDGSRTFSWRGGVPSGDEPGWLVEAAHPDGMLLARTWQPFSEQPDRVVLIDLTHAITESLDLSASNMRAVFSPDGTMLAIDDETGGMQLFQTGDTRPRMTFHSAPTTERLTFSPDGTLLAAESLYSNKVVVWRIGTPEPFATLTNASITPLSKLIITSDNQLVLIGGPEGLSIYRLSDSQLLYHQDGAVVDLAIGPRRRLLGILRESGQIELWGVGE